MKEDLYFLCKEDRACKVPNRERPKKLSVPLGIFSICIKIDEIKEIRCPLSKVIWTDSTTGRTGVGWVLSSRLKKL